MLKKLSNVHTLKSTIDAAYLDLCSFLVTLESETTVKGLSYLMQLILNLKIKVIAGCFKIVAMHLFLGESYRKTASPPI